MKEYQKAKALLIAGELKSSTLTSYVTKWANIAVSATDLELQQRIFEFVELVKYRPVFQKKWGYSTYSTPVTFRQMQFTEIKGWQEVYRIVRKELEDYIDYRLSEQKPAWQVMAEKHGWIPPM